MPEKPEHNPRLLKWYQRKPAAAKGRERAEGRGQKKKVLDHVHSLRIPTPPDGIRRTGAAGTHQTTCESHAPHERNRRMPSGGVGCALSCEHASLFSLSLTPHPSPRFVFPLPSSLFPHLQSFPLAAQRRRGAIHARRKSPTQATQNHFPVLHVVHSRSGVDRRTAVGAGFDGSETAKLLAA